MRKVVKIMMGMALVMGIPLCAFAQESITGQNYQDASTQASRAAAEARQEIRQEVRDTRQDLQDKKDDATMRRLEREENKQTTGEYLDDAAITAKVKGKFVGQKGLDSLDIKVVTVDGSVTLMGDVDNSSQIGVAEDVAKQVDGVKRVENKLVLKK
ncbi:MAG: hypothetical protein DELT_01010 [Desulfovibrio sp.]